MFSSTVMRAQVTVRCISLGDTTPQPGQRLMSHMILAAAAALQRQVCSTFIREHTSKLQRRPRHERARVPAQDRLCVDAGIRHTGFW